MKPYYENEAVTLYHGDCREVLPELGNASIDMIFTDPPYGHNNNDGDLISRWEAALGRLPSGADQPVARPIANDGVEANEMVRWFFKEAARLLKGEGRESGLEHGRCGGMSRFTTTPYVPEAREVERFEEVEPLAEWGRGRG